MSDEASSAQAMGAPGGNSNEPPIKQFSIDNAPPTAASESAATPVDDGSDFYNTPLVAGTPVNASENAQTSANDSEPATSSKSAPLIPGLSLFNEGVAAGSSDPAGKVNNHDETEQDSTPAGETMQVDAEKADSEMRDAPAAPSNASAEEQSTKQDGLGSQQQDNASEPAAAQTSDGMQTRESERQDATVLRELAEEGEHPEWEIDSSPYESSSDDSLTDSSDDDSEEDDEDYPILSPEEQARILMMAEAGSDDEEGKGKSGGAYVRTTNEQPEEVPPIPDVTVTPDMKIEFLGNVQAIVDNTVLIRASTSGEYQVLESGSLLCLEDRSIVGVVSETLGRVQEPLYTVRFESAAAVGERGVEKEKQIYYVPQHSTFVFTQPLKGLKGSDASNFHDEEIGEEEMEFSDDEAEAEYKRKLKLKRQEKKQAKNESAGVGRTRRENPGPSKLGQMELNYDDVSGGDGYTPLARPANLHEMMTTQDAPVERSHHPGRGGRGGRGRGGSERGSGRGRGGRGGSWDSRRSYGDDRRQGRDPRQDSSASNESEQNPYMPPPPFPQAQQQAQQQQQQQQQFYNPAQFAAYPAYPQTQQQYPQFPAASQFTFQTPYQQPFQQPYQQNPYQQLPAGSPISPALIAALQQHQQMQQQQQQQQQQASYPQSQNQAAALSQVQAQLDLLRQLSGGGGQGPPRS
ncbi:hypothetical protein DTO021D3_8518 [Paecilomyces variotii]|nr:hypothetical protein DTO032I3_2707 [Paecilomyces variotii]KAJ9274633.1 hypothetical protein DTO021D3_8518 [Paecilomyces variotii]KAJ9298018.1 hypothetical protein DTO217A2_8515 [Paecilomyces variotii]KAJ9344420.1 hypothetical protein DTO027B6_3038 [Paecilomyces variotii]KAJ9388277.1 hypothetical protein DTO032I4_2901 [Paecilomyces variotii]